MNFVSRFFVASILCGAAGSAYGQGQTSAANATAAATVVAPIEIVKTANLDFGNLAVGTAAGTVLMDPSGTRTASGGVTLPSTSGSPSPASFTVTGQGNYTFAITLPSTHTLNDGASHTMTLTNFTSSLGGPTGTLASGTKVVTVGATLNAGASQAVGAYTSAGGTGFEVKVEYN